MPELSDLEEAARIVKNGGVIAYPTEAVFGIGCDPLNADAVQRVIRIKERDPGKGLIIVAASVDQVVKFIDRNKIPDAVWEEMNKVWPGPYTYIVPSLPVLPSILTGGRNTVAIRVSADASVCALCNAAGMPLVSSSLNLSGKEPVRDPERAVVEFGSLVDYVVKRPTGGRTRPSQIRDALTGRIIRA